MTLGKGAFEYGNDNPWRENIANADTLTVFDLDRKPGFGQRRWNRETATALGTKVLQTQIHSLFFRSMLEVEGKCKHGEKRLNSETITLGAKMLKTQMRSLFWRG